MQEIPAPNHPSSSATTASPLPALECDAMSLVFRRHSRRLPRCGRGGIPSRSHELATTSGETAVHVERLTGGGEEFRRLAQPTARGFGITFRAVQVRASFGYRRLPCASLPQGGGPLSDRQMVAGIV